MTNLELITPGDPLHAIVTVCRCIQAAGGGLRRPSGRQPRREGFDEDAGAAAAAGHRRHASGVSCSTHDSAPERVRRAYTEANYQRLTTLKATYDPDQLFRVNHNIPPLRHGNS